MKIEMIILTIVYEMCLQSMDRQRGFKELIFLALDQYGTNSELNFKKLQRVCVSVYEHACACSSIYNTLKSLRSLSIVFFFFCCNFNKIRM